MLTPSAFIAAASIVVKCYREEEHLAIIKNIILNVINVSQPSTLAAILEVIRKHQPEQERECLTAALGYLATLPPKKAQPFCICLLLGPQLPC